MEIDSLIHFAILKGASDLHLITYSPPLVRINGVLVQGDNYAPLTPEDMDDFFVQITSEKDRVDFERNLELDFGYSIPHVGRFRCNAARQRGSLSLVIRLLPPTIPSIDEIGLPEICKSLILKSKGLVIVSGATGSGKSTTLAAMIEHLNKSEGKRVVTIEDPIEYLYSSQKCTITQRELGNDTKSFSEALKHVLRQDPDVIMVGEMRDLESAAAVLTIAETGHLVLTTGHAPSAPQALERIIDLFPPHERYLAQSRLASLVIAVLCQVLVTKEDGEGRVPAVEIMLASPAVKNLIREGKTYQLSNAIRTQSQMGMQLLDQALVNLYINGTISSDTLFLHCNDANEVAELCSKITVS